jgi:hypothetical protein
MDSTARYLGVELEDALANSEAVEMLKQWAGFIKGPLLPFGITGFIFCKSRRTNVNTTHFQDYARRDWTKCRLRLRSSVNKKVFASFVQRDLN